MAGVGVKFRRWPTFTGRGGIYFLGGGAAEARGGGGVVWRCGRGGWQAGVGRSGGEVVVR